eukprot:Skav205680  [mRNA]  locus=scaffold2818:144954:148166:+ [translate_table: standard]
MDTAAQMFGYLELLPDGHQFLRSLHDSAWYDLKLNRSVCDFLAHTCIACGAWCGRVQSLMYHVKTNHPELVPNTTLKAAELSVGQAGDCSYCARQFKGIHTCPVMYQLGMLLANDPDASRRNDLQAHLMNTHSEMWHASQPITMHLTELFGPAGCVCAPMIATHRLDHVCVPITQIAMMAIQLELHPFIPVDLNGADLNWISHDLSLPCRMKIQDFVHKRAFEPLWLDSEIIALLRHSCLTCAKQVHPQMMQWRIHKVHGHGHDASQPYMHQILPLITAKMTRADICELCHMVINAPSAQLTDDSARECLEIHLCLQCPVTSQLCSIFTAGHGRLEQQLMDGARGAEPIPGDVPRSSAPSDETLGKRRRVTRRQQTTQRPSDHRTSGDAHRPHPEADDAGLDSTRPSPGERSSRGHIHLFLSPRPIGLLTQADSGSCGLEDPSSAAAGGHIPASPSLPDSVPGTGEQGEPCGRIGTGRPHDQAARIPESAAPGKEVAIPIVESDDEEDGGERKASSDNGQHGPKVQDLDRDPEGGQGLCGSFSHDEAHIHHGALENAVTLRDMDTFATLFSEWDRTHVAGQGDIAEFAADLMLWSEFTPALLDHRWEKRLAVLDQPNLELQSIHHHMCIVLSPPHPDHGTHTTVQALIEHWHREQSMFRGLVSTPTILCLHLDRGAMDSHGNTCYNPCVIECEPTVTMPVLQPDSLQTTQQVYCLVAFSSYYGQDMAGHCQAQLLVADSTFDTFTVLHTNDDRLPRLTKVPTYSQDTVLVWFCRADQVDLPTVQQLRNTDDLMRLFSGVTP